VQAAQKSYGNNNADSQKNSLHAIILALAFYNDATGGKVQSACIFDDAIIKMEIPTLCGCSGLFFTD
jgi:hypothetical protein